MPSSGFNIELVVAHKSSPALPGVARHSWEIEQGCWLEGLLIVVAVGQTQSPQGWSVGRELLTGPTGCYQMARERADHQDYLSWNSIPIVNGNLCSSEGKG